MKKIIAFTVVLFFPALAFSQDYFPFPQSNALWNFKITGSLIPPHEWAIIDSLGEEISIGALPYTKVYREEHILGAIREDPMLKQVYFNNFFTEIVLYDFTLDVGDTIFYTTNLFYSLDYYKVVDSIDSITIEGQFRKRWHLTNSLYGLTDIWIEGIGSVYRYGLLYPNDPDIVLDGSTPYFGCFSHDTTVYVNESACQSSCPCSWWLVQVDDVPDRPAGIHVFPSPFAEELTIEAPGDPAGIVDIRVYTMNGLMMMNTVLPPHGKTKIDASSWPNGMYMLHVTSASRSSFQKIVKCH